MQDQVHLGDGDHRAVVLLPVQRKVLAVPALLLDVLRRLDQHPAGTDSRVVDLHALLGPQKLHQQAHDPVGRVELPALLAGAVGEELDQVLVGRAQQVGELEVVVDEL